MESFEDIRQKEFAYLMGEIAMLGRRLVDLGWSCDQVLAYVRQLFSEPTDTPPGDPNSIRKEGRP